ncbi:MAG TPA: hypothetical protein VK106_06105 [Balneolaceae bacterium]|nr:hypothetical protein [Balneolaceae bacterium]
MESSCSSGILPELYSRFSVTVSNCKTIALAAGLIGLGLLLFQTYR